MAIAFEDSRRALEQQLSTRLDVVHIVLLVFLSTFIIWAVTGEIDVYRTSQSGTLKSKGGALSVQSEVTANIKATNVSLGMRVKKDDLLIQLDDTPAQLNLSKLQDELLANQQQQRLLREQKQLTEQKYQLAESSLSQEIKQIQAQLEQAEKVLSTQKNIQQGFKALAQTSAVAKVDLLRQELEVVQAESNTKVNAIALDNKRQQIPRNQREQEIAISQINTQLSVLKDQHEQLSRSIERAQLEVDKYAIKAENDGEIVQLITLPLGNRISVGEKVATISNGGDWMIHSSFNAADAVGHVKQGQLARVLVDGFPWRQYGSLEAIVSHVAKEGLQDQVDVLLEIRDNTQSQIPLTFGQPVTIEIKTQTVTPMLLLLNAADRAIRRKPENAS